MNTETPDVVQAAKLLDRIKGSEITLALVREVIRRAEPKDSTDLQNIARMAWDKARLLSQQELMIGDWVEFQHKGYTIRGRVEKRNKKTAGLVDNHTRCNKRWRSYRVGYSALTKVDQGF